MITNIAKGGLLIFWLVFLYSFINPFAQPYQMIIFWFGILLIVVHLLEFVVYRKKLDKFNAGGSKGFIQ
ncbi:MAG: DUF1145 domain-containing protein, partial [Gammaproteobacteria bacterium]|nr:DUF1145 domain-containing protein [Gammaproteobacteria bacterium]